MLLLLLLAFAPPVPQGAKEGDLVEVEGVTYEVWDGELVEVADDEAELVDVVTGSRVQGTGNSAVKTDIISRETLEESGSRTLSDALQRVGGLQVGSDIGTSESVSMDGLDGKYVKILIDGRPVNGTTNSRVDISRLPISMADVERIEIVRGPMSALYGSDAMAGVINLITRRPTSQFHVESELLSRIDQLGLGRTGVSLRTTTGNKFYALKLSASGLFDRGTDRATRLADGEIIDRPDGALDIAHKRSLTFGFDGSVYPNDDWALRFYGSAQSHDVETRFSRLVPFRDHTADMQFELGTVVEGDLALGHSIKLDTRISRYLHRFEKLPDAGSPLTPPFCAHAEGGLFFDAPCAAPANIRTRARQDQTRTELSYQGTLAEDVPFAHQLRLAVGGVFTYERVSRLNGDFEDTLPGGGDRTLAALFSELAYSPFASLRLVPGVRAEFAWPGAGDDALAYAVSPRLSARYQLPLGVAVRASYGQGFRLPDFIERYLRFDHSELGYIVEGNPDLLPESSRGVRGEILWQKEDAGQVGVEAFLNLSENLIDSVATGTLGADPLAQVQVPIFSYVNRSRAYTSGINVSLRSSPHYGFSVDATYQYLINAVDASRCPPENPWFCSAAQGALSLPMRPIHSGHLGLRYQVAATSTTLFSQADYLGERTQQDGGVISDSLRLSVGLRQPLFERTEVLLTLDNLLDSYGPVFGPKPGRSALVTLRAGF